MPLLEKLRRPEVNGDRAPWETLSKNSAGPDSSQGMRWRGPDIVDNDNPPNKHLDS